MIYIPRLIPLKQWVCDTCGYIIERPEDGYIQFKEDEQTREYVDFIIVHHKSASPYRKVRGVDGCYQYTSDEALTTFLGQEGFVRLLELIDPREQRYRSSMMNPEGIASWIELVRRLYIPYYEEARLYWSQAEVAGFFDGANEVWKYLPENLYRLIQKFEPKNNG